jgi:hypothetical protein
MASHTFHSGPPQRWRRNVAALTLVEHHGPTLSAPHRLPPVPWTPPGTTVGAVDTYSIYNGVNERGTVGKVAPGLFAQEGLVLAHGLREPGRPPSVSGFRLLPASLPSSVCNIAQWGERGHDRETREKGRATAPGGAGHHPRDRPHGPTREPGGAGRGGSISRRGAVPPKIARPRQPLRPLRNGAVALA